MTKLESASPQNSFLFQKQNILILITVIFILILNAFPFLKQNTFRF